MCTQVYTMETQRVGIREFRESLSTYLLQSHGPIAITRHGDTVGYFIPRRRKRTAEEKAASRASWDRVQKMMKEKGITEEDIIRDLEELRKKKHK